MRDSYDCSSNKARSLTWLPRDFVGSAGFSRPLLRACPLLLFIQYKDSKWAPGDFHMRYAGLGFQGGFRVGCFGRPKLFRRQ